MKILRLHFQAFGPFTDLLLDLSGGQEGLHILYGPNEAGKSSALRALRQLLYGIPARSPDDFVHPYKKMRIGGVLRHSDGTVMEVTRRKGNRNTLRDGDDDQPVDEKRFQKFLGNMEEPVFATMFGIGHEDLVRGGEEIIQGGGDVGHALFAAGSGIADLRRVQMELQAEAEALFTPAASTREINKSITAFKETQRALREAQLPGQDWERHHTSLLEVTARRESVDRGLQVRETEHHRLERIRDALPLISRRQDDLEELAGLADASLLPEDFGERRTRFLTELRIAESRLDQARNDAEETARAMEDLRIYSAVLDRAESIESLYRDLGGFQKAARDRGRLTGLRDSLWSEAREILAGLRRDVTLEQAEGLRVKRALTVRIQELGKQYERLMERLDTAREALPLAKDRVRALEEELAAHETPLPLDGLRKALARATGVAAMEDRHAVECAEIERSRRSLERVLEKQSLWQEGLEELDRLPLPSMATVEAFDRPWDEAGQTVSRLRSECRDAEEALARAAAGLQGVEGDVPTEDDLAKARAQREQGWALIRRALRTGVIPGEEAARYTAGAGTAPTLEEAYETRVRRADETADRLRREADRVARKAGLLAEQEAGRERLERLRSRLAEAEVAQDELAAAWRQAWEPAGISPQTPREMRAWIQDQQNVLERFHELRERSRKAEALEREFTDCRKELSDRLRDLSLEPAGENETLSDLTDRCREIVERQETLRAREERLLSDKRQKEREQKEVTLRLEKAEGDLAQWQRGWEEAVQPLGLDADALPAQADAVMQDLAALFDKLKEAGILHKRIQGIDRDGEAYTGQVIALVDHAARDLGDLPVEEAVSKLHARLNRTREAVTQRDRLIQEKDRQEDRVRKAEDRIREMTSALQAMCEEAGCPGHTDLLEAETRSNRRRRVEADLKALEEQLHGLCGGASIDAFVAEARTVDPDGMEGRLLRLERDMGGLREERTALDQAIGEERNELSKMDGSSRAAGLAEEAQGILAGLSRGVEAYARLRLASTVLARSVERYRERHQGPVLKRTNELFARLTLGRFDGVRAEYDEQGNPALVGVRPGTGEIVPVHGMSDGTADQLYLALRLASLEAYLEAGEPMPFIVDDILIKFDDDRARAALEVLAELSRRTQVIFFTHHRHLMELAEAVVEPGLMQTQTL